MEKFREILAAVLYAIPGFYFALTQHADIFSTIGIVAIAWIVFMIAGYSSAACWVLADEYSKVKNLPNNISVNEKLRAAAITMLVLFLILTALAAIFGGSMYFGGAIYSVLAGIIDRNLIRPDAFLKMKTNIMLGK